MQYIQLAVMAYLAVAIAKFILTAPAIPVAIVSLSRVSGVPRGEINPFFYWVVPVGVVCVLLLMWPRFLLDEKLDFFRAYSNREVMRDCVSIHKKLMKE